MTRGMTKSKATTSLQAIVKPTTITDEKITATEVSLYTPFHNSSALLSRCFYARSAKEL